MLPFCGSESTGYRLFGSPATNAIGKWIAPPVTPDKALKALGKAQHIAF
jgi:hypothetical protein